MAPEKKSQNPSTDAPGQAKKPEKNWDLAASQADERNALIAAWDEINIGNHKTWKVSRREIVTIWGESAFSKGHLTPNLEYKGLPVELDE